VAAGVSKGLVSKVFNGGAGPSAAMTARVLAVADALGYRPNRGAALLAERRPRLIGLTVLPSNLFHGELVDQLQVIAQAHGYDVVLGTMTGYSHERHTIETLIDFRCEALLLVGPDPAAGPARRDHRTRPRRRPLRRRTRRARGRGPISLRSGTAGSPTSTAARARSPPCADVPTAPP
jgi:DNA-binding LacI/PurR family transcriptional regulator